MLKTVSSITNAIGALNFKGTWNATTNTPTIVSGVGVKGDYFVVGVAGSTTIDGISNWGIGDWIAYNGNIWQRVEGGADLNGVNLSVSGTTTLSNLTASTALALNATKEVVSVANTGTGDNVLATSPTLVTPILGTPQSGTVTNLTGTASININGTVGATTPAAVSATTLNTSGQVVFNDAGADVDFRVEGDTEANLLFVDASTDRVGIGQSSPGTRLHVSGSQQPDSLGQENILRIARPTTAGVKFGTSAEFSLGTFETGLGQARSRLDLRLGHGNILSPDTTVATFLSSGNVGIGTTSPAQRLHVNGTIRYTNRPAAGTITAIGFDTNGDLKASSSSLRYKHDIEDYNKGLSEVMQLRPVSFKFNGENRTNIGFIAEEIENLGLTEVMLYDEEEKPEGVIYANMVSLLTKAIQELKAELDTVKAELATMKGN